MLQFLTYNLTMKSSIFFTLFLVFLNSSMAADEPKFNLAFKDNNLEETDDEFLDFGFEYDLTDYWFTKEKIDLIKEVHDYIDSFEYTGKVLSLASVIRVAEELNSDKEFVFDTLLIYFLKTSF